MDSAAMNEPRQPPEVSRFSRRDRTEEARRRWQQAGYPPEVVARLRWDRRYSIIGIGRAEFAFSRYEDYVAGLRAAWAARLVPRYGPSSLLGIELPDFVTDLRGVDVEISRHR
jgi:hypothetical protein